MEAKDVKSIGIQARRWFQKSYGNNYFTAMVTVNHTMENEQSFILPFQYGYDRHYEEAARQELIKRGFVKMDDFEYLHRYCQANGVEYHVSHVDVKRKKDLQF